MDKKLLLILILMFCTLFLFIGCNNNQPVEEISTELEEKVDEPVVNTIDKPKKDEIPVDLEKDSEVNEEDIEPIFEDRTLRKDNYEVMDSEIAKFFSYDYQDRSMYIAGLKVFDEFSNSNEGSVSIYTNENALTFSMTKSTGTVTGAVDGPQVYFKMDLTTNEIIDKQFTPAPNYIELGKTEYIQHSEEVIELSDERMIEIGMYFKELILEIEAI